MYVKVCTACFYHCVYCRDGVYEQETGRRGRGGGGEE